MTSPLFPIRNTRILTTTTSGVTLEDGRVKETAGDTYLFEAYMKRAQYSGVASGSQRVPLFSQLDGRMLPGGDGDKFYYRGYVLRKAIVDDSFDWADWYADDSLLTWVDVLENPDELRPQQQVKVKMGNENIMLADIQRSSGVFGGRGIDVLLYQQIQGVELQFQATELL